MSNSRDAFLRCVRQAVAAGNRAGQAPPPEPRGATGYQGAGPDPLARFAEALTAAGGYAHVVPDSEAAVRTIMELVRARSARKILLGRGAFLDTLSLRERLSQVGQEVTAVDNLGGESGREALFAADVGISGVDALVAETGTVVVSARPDEPRSLTLLPPVHIAVAARQQLLPDLFDLFERVGPAAGQALPSCLTLITGPSKTGDIELRLVTGVHGPGDVHVVLVAS